MMVNNAAPSPTLIGEFQNRSNSVIRAGAWLVSFCLVLLELGLFGSTFPGTNPLFVWPQFAVAMLLTQILCGLILARYAVIYVSRQRRIPWLSLTGMPLLLVSLFLFYASASIQEPYTPLASHKMDVSTC